LPSTGSIEGTLVGFRERPKITVDHGRVPEADVAGDQFVFGDLAEGTYQLTASSPAGDFARGSATVTGDAVTRVTLTASSAHVEGALTRWPGGEPIAGARCEWIF